MAPNESIDLLEIRSHNAAAILTFPPGDGYPRLSQSALKTLASLLETIRRDGIFRGVVIGSDAGSFGTGADIGELANLDARTARDFAARGQELFNRISAFEIPVVAAIRGFCLGGGLDLALACHARVATFDSTFGHLGGALGLITGWGGTQRLPRLIGKGQALQMLLTGDRVPATQALTLGLVDELVASQDLTDAAVRRCERLGQVQLAGNL